MIDLIKTVNIDVTGLSNDKEIENYIPTQLIKHYPDPKSLKFHYTITGTRDRKSALVSYIHRDKLSDSIYIKYPTLLFESKLKKCGHYIFIFSTTLLEVTLKDRVVLSTKTISLSKDTLKDTLQDDSVVIYDLGNKDLVSNLKNKTIQLEKLYNSCRSTLFKKRRKSLLPIVSIGAVALLTIISINLSQKYIEAINEYNNIKSRYTEIVTESSMESELETTYNQLLEEHYTLKSGLEPDLYTVIYEITSGNHSKRVMNLNYSDYAISLNVLTTNGITLTRDLNSSTILDLRQNSSVSQDNYEIVSVTGEVICP